MLIRKSRFHRRCAAMLMMLCLLGQGCVRAESNAANIQTELAGILGEALSLDDYKAFYQDENYLRLYLKEGGTASLPADMALVDGTVIQLPMRYGELLQAGWVSHQTMSDPFPSRAAGNAVHTSAQGKTMAVGVVNPATEMCALDCAWINCVSLGGDYTADFQLGGISRGSTLAELTACWGKPYHVDYYRSGETVQLTLDYQDSDSEVSFGIDLQSGCVVSVIWGYAYTSIPQN